MFVNYLVNQTQLIMKRTALLLIIVFLGSIVYSQEKKEKIKLGIFSSHAHNFEYLNGKVSEIHYKTFHITAENEKIVKGEPFTWDEAQNVQLRQPWSYYYNELGQLVKMATRGGNGSKWTGVVHYENDRIENIYWLKKGKGLKMDIIEGEGPKPATGNETFTRTTHAEEDRIALLPRDEIVLRCQSKPIMTNELLSNGRAHGGTGAEQDDAIGGKLFDANLNGTGEAIGLADLMIQGIGLQRIQVGPAWRPDVAAPVDHWQRRCLE